MTVLTHRRPPDTIAALRAPGRAGAEAGVTLRSTRRRRASTGLHAGPGLELERPGARTTSSCAWCSAGTARSCARCALCGHQRAGVRGQLRRDRVPRDGRAGRARRTGIARALSGEFELLQLPAIVLDGRPRTAGGAGARAGSTTSRSTARSASGSRRSPTRWRARMVGSVRCDGLVIATPAGSTGYNLANGGPVMAWGVEGFVVSFIAPHSLTARALVVAPEDRLTIHNRSREPLDVAVDGRPAGEIAARRHDRRALRGCGRHDRPAAGLLVLPPPAREVRPPGELTVRDRLHGPAAPVSRSVTARCAASDRSPPRRRAPSSSVAAQRGDELSSWSREKRRWPPGVR